MYTTPVELKVVVANNGVDVVNEVANTVLLGNLVAESDGI